MRWLIVSLVAGWAVGTALSVPPWAAFAGVAAAVLALWFRARPSWVLAAWVLAAVSAGALRGPVTPWWTAPPRRTAVRLDGRVVRGCDPHGDVVRCLVESDGLGLVSLRAPAGRCEAAPGDRLTAVVDARPVVPWRNPPLEDPAQQALRRGVAWRAETARCVVTGRSPRGLDRWRRVARGARRSVDGALRRALSPAGAARAEALLFGDERGLDESTVEAFRETGLAHLLAVSGAHVAVVLRGLGVALAWLLRRWPWLTARGLGWRLAAVLPLPIAALFVTMTGESPASLRALVSGALASLLALWGRRARAIDVLALTVGAMALVEPALRDDLGLQLSTVATAALVTRSGAAGARGWSARVREAWWATVRVGLAVMPLLALRFGRAPGVATLANLVAAPLAEVVALPLTLATAAAARVSPTLATPLAWADERALALLFDLAGWARELPFASLRWPVPTPWQAAVMTASLLLAGAVAWRGRLALLVVVALALGAMEGCLRCERATHGGLRVTALDVGQGDAIVVDLPDGRTMLVDAGGALHGEADPGAAVVVPWLRATRRTRLDVVVLTHPHPDHGGGLRAVFESIEVGEFWETGQGRALGVGGFYAEAVAAAERHGVARREAVALCGSRSLGGARVAVLAPCPAVDPSVPPNDASLVIRLDLGRASALLTGDLEAGGERQLLPRLSPVTLLKVGHHGSRTSSTEAFLRALRPDVALVSSGHPSPFGHPHPAVLERLQRHGVALRRTDRDGLSPVLLRPDGTTR